MLKAELTKTLISWLHKQDDWIQDTLMETEQALIDDGQHRRIRDKDTVNMVAEQLLSENKLQEEVTIKGYEDGFWELLCKQSIDWQAVAKSIAEATTLVNDPKELV